MGQFSKKQITKEVNKQGKKEVKQASKQFIQCQNQQTNQGSITALGPNLQNILRFITRLS